MGKLEQNSAYGKGNYPMDAVSAYPPVGPVIDYRVSQGRDDLIIVTCQDCGTEMTFSDGVRLEDIGNAVTAHESDADESGCKYARAAVGAITPMLPMDPPIDPDKYSHDEDWGKGDD